DAARYVVAILIGEFPENLGSELKKPGMLPVLPNRVRAGLPIDLLRRRPDIVEAERQLASATAQIGVATADLFPQVAVTPVAGRQTGIRSDRSFAAAARHRGSRTPVGERYRTDRRGHGRSVSASGGDPGRRTPDRY